MWNFNIEKINNEQKAFTFCDGTGIRAKGGIGGDAPPRSAVVVRVTTDRRSNGVNARDAMVKRKIVVMRCCGRNEY